MTLQDIMDPRIGCVSANDYAAEALRLMIARNLNWIFVLDRNEIAGVIQAKELARWPDERLKERDVREFMTPHFLTIPIETEANEAARLLKHSGLRFAGITRNNLPVGFLTPDTLPRCDQLSLLAC